MVLCAARCGGDPGEGRAAVDRFFWNEAVVPYRRIRPDERTVSILCSWIGAVAAFPRLKGMGKLQTLRNQADRRVDRQQCAPGPTSPFPGRKSSRFRGGQQSADVSDLYSVQGRGS